MKLNRFNVLVCHRRFGKTVFSVNQVIDSAVRNTKRNPQYAYIAPTYKQAKMIAWDMFKDATKRFPGVKTHEQELKIEIPRGDDKIKIMLLGAENPDSIRGIYLDGVILDEFGDQNPILWSQVVRPTLTDRLGWAVFIGTPKGNNHFLKMHHMARGEMEKDKSQWFTSVFKASRTGLVSRSELEQARLTMTQEEYDQEYECSFESGLVGSYYKEQLQGLRNDEQITGVPFEPGISVDTAWDLGIDDSTAIWFIQTVGREIHVIDYIEFSSKGFPEIVKLLKEYKYTYRDHYLPWDAGHKELGTGRTRQETLVNLGLANRENLIVTPKLAIEDGINAVRLLLPRCWFDLNKCDRGIDALHNYEREFDSKEGVFRSRPRHNWASHGADAFRTLAVGFRGDSDRVDRKLLLEEVDVDYDMWGY